MASYKGELHKTGFNSKNREFANQIQKTKNNNEYEYSKAT